MILVVLILFSIFSLDTTKNMEGYDPQTRVNLEDISTVRDFLEEMYTISINDRTEKADGEHESTICYKSSVLGRHISTQLGKYIESYSIELLWKRLGPAVICPTNGECTDDNKDGINAGATAILTSQKDYFMLMQLCTSANALIPFIDSSTNPIWKYNTVSTSPIYDANGLQTEPGGASTVPYDVCLRYDPSSKALTGQITVLYNKIYEALEYFHFQIKNTDTGENGDTWETRIY